MKRILFFIQPLQARFYAACLMLCVLLLSIFVSCRPEYTPVGMVSQDYVPLINSNPWTTAASYTTGQTISFELQFLSYAPIREIALIQLATRRVGTSTVTTVDTAIVSRTPYMAAFSQTKQCDTLLMSYTVPDSTRLTRLNLVNVRVGVLVVNQNNLSKLRTTGTFTVR